MAQMTVPAGTAANTTTFTTVRMHMAQFVRGNYVLGWADQAVVSATSFLIMVLIGRSTTPHELGVYAIGMSIVAILIAAQESLITRPYSIQIPRIAGSPKDHAFSTFALSLLFSACAASISGAAALLFSAFNADRALVNIAWALAGACPFVLIREFARRFAFAHMAFADALVLDCIVAMLAMLTLTILNWFGQLSAANAVGAIGLACGFASFGWLYRASSEFSWHFRELSPTLARNWKMGRWFLSSQLVIQIQAYMGPWLALTIAGAALTGIYAACTSIVAFVNPVLFGAFNVLLPKFVRVLQQQGLVGLRRQAYLESVLLAAIMAAFALVIFEYGDEIMHLLFRGNDYLGYRHVLTVLSVASLAAAVGAPASIALAAADHARSVTFVTAVTASLNLVLIAVLLPSYGLLGAAYGVLAAEGAGSTGRWVTFLLLSTDCAGRQHTTMA
jgi:O-antigen/teichoic acid export membrane protein